MLWENLRRFYLLIAVGTLNRSGFYSLIAISKPNRSGFYSLIAISKPNRSGFYSLIAVSEQKQQTISATNQNIKILLVTVILVPSVFFTAELSVTVLLLE